VGTRFCQKIIYKQQHLTVQMNVVPIEFAEQVKCLGVLFRVSLMDDNDLQR